MNDRFFTRNRLQRRGSMLTELIVAAGLIITGTGLVATCVVAGQRMHRMQREHSLAVDELSNQLERLLALPPSELESTLHKLTPSDWLAYRLPEPELTAQRYSDEFGDRLELKLQWKRVGDPPPIAAVAWLNVNTPTSRSTP